MSALGIISLLINVLIVALFFYLVLWIVEICFGPLPPKIKQILMAIFGLIILLWILQFFLGGAPLLFWHVH
jgi:hypothetical protein